MTGLRCLSVYCLAAALVFASVAMLCTPNAVSMWRAAATQRLRTMLDIPLPVSIASIAIAPPENVPVRRDTNVAVRLKQMLTPELRANFELFLYVNKAEAGPAAQRMVVFKKTADGALTRIYDWPVSTGREKREATPSGRHRFTDTPRGYYEIDPKRMYASYHSRTWDQPMPYTMFFNWVRKGYKTGLAIHAATGAAVAHLGQRASAGCIHLSLENARRLFFLVNKNYRGMAPRFAFDRGGATMSNQGVLMRDAKGRIERVRGYKVLVIVDDFSASLQARRFINGRPA